MSEHRRDRSVLRWYPEAWRTRYGDELAALLEDTYGDRAIPVRDHLALMGAGIRQRLRGPQSERDGNDAREGVRSGSLLVLCAWTVFIVSGAVFAKFIEHWDVVTPLAARHLPGIAVDAVQGAALAGAVIVLIAATLCLPSFVRHLRRGGWAQIRRPVLRAVVLIAAALLSSVGIVGWAHHLVAVQRNGSYLPFAAGALAWVGLIVASIASCAVAAVAVVRRLRLPDRVLRICGALALAMTLVMAVVLAGTVVWWSAVAADAPWFFGDGRVGSATFPAPAELVVISILMVLGLTTAAMGSWRVVRHLARVPSD
jgi:hypothetical protein